MPYRFWGLLDSCLAAKEGDIEEDVFETLKAALALAQDGLCDQVMPVGNEPPWHERAGLDLLTKVQSESVKMRAALQGLVQSERMTRTRHSHRGRQLDGKRLHHLSLGDTQVFLRSTVKASPNTAIHLLVDKSESMGYPLADNLGNALGTRMPIALEASLALALALEGLPGVNPGITAFPGSDDESVYRLLEHGQRVKSRTGAFALSPSGSTPMTEAIWFGAASLLRCREPRKVLIVMADGQPNDKLSTLEILQRCRDSGIETVGIGLGIEVSHLFPVAITINDFRELRGQLFELSKTLLMAA
jgi:nitric oxide reductase activation protein